MSMLESLPLLLKYGCSPPSTLSAEARLPRYWLLWLCSAKTSELILHRICYSAQAVGVICSESFRVKMVTSELLPHNTGQFQLELMPVR